MGPTDPSGRLTPGRRTRSLCGVGLAAAGLWCLSTPLLAAPRPTLGPESAEPEVRTVAAGLDLPWGLAFLPDGSTLVTERDSARVLHVTAEAEVDEVATIEEVDAGGEGGLLGVAVSPDFETDHHVFLYYSTASDNRIVRATYQDGQLGEPEVILDGIPHSGTRHDGGRLAFGPDRMLYAATGDAGEGDRAQDQSSLGGKILRMTVDGEPAEGNPFEGSLVWSYGHRNPQGLAWDPAGRMYASELGEDTWDELNRIEPGANYGWPADEGPAEGGDGGEGGDAGDHVDPLITWSPAEASPSDAAYLDGALYVAALRGGRLWRVPLDGDGSAGEPQALLQGDHGRLRAVEAAPDGTLWVTTSNGGGNDQILALTFADPGSAPSSPTSALCPRDPPSTSSTSSSTSSSSTSTSTSPSTTVSVLPLATIDTTSTTSSTSSTTTGGSTTTPPPGSTTTGEPTTSSSTPDDGGCGTTTSTTTPCDATTSSSSSTSPSITTGEPTTTTSPPCMTTTSSTAPNSTTTTTPSTSSTTTMPSSTTTSPACPPGPTSTSSSTTSTSSTSTSSSTTSTSSTSSPSSTTSTSSTSSPSTTVTVQPLAGTDGSSTTTSTAAGGSSTTSATSPPCPSSTTAPPTTQAPTTTTSAPGGSLPRTGSDTGQLVALGAGLLIAGVLLVVSTHRHKPQPALATEPTHPPPNQKPPAATSIFETWKRSRFGGA